VLGKVVWQGRFHFGNGEVRLEYAATLYLSAYHVFCTLLPIYVKKKEKKLASIEKRKKLT
jgi:hypothetical protein